MKVALVLLLIAAGFGLWNLLDADTYDGRSLIGVVLLVLAGVRIFTLPDPEHDPESEYDRDR